MFPFFSKTAPPILMKLCVEHVHIPWSDMEKFQKIQFTNKKFSLITTFFPQQCRNVPLSENVRICVHYVRMYIQLSKNVRICVPRYLMSVFDPRSGSFRRVSRKKRVTEKFINFHTVFLVSYLKFLGFGSFSRGLMVFFSKLGQTFLKLSVHFILLIFVTNLLSPRSAITKINPKNGTKEK